ncbi:MAG: DoxX family membrane protein [Candidatus Omnitrophica bacterium]|nr:DoxX family membrane protein [Candidatus Omnitrophota bacterium]
MNKGFNIFIFLRVTIGGFFVLVSVDTLMGPFQNFLYVVQAYEIFPDIVEKGVAFIVPWVEFFLGVFLVIGLWTRNALKGLLVLVTGLIGVVSSAIIRGLPLDDCGCFGELFSVSLKGTLLIDIALFVFVGLMLVNLAKTSLLSLDQYYQKTE